MHIKVIVHRTECGRFRAEVPSVPICIPACDSLEELQGDVRKILSDAGSSRGFEGIEAGLCTPDEFEGYCDRIRSIPHLHLLETLINSMPDFIYVKDLESRFIVCNECSARSLGADRSEEVIGKTDFDLHPLEKAMLYFSDEQKVMLTGRPLIGREELVACPDGSERWYSSSKVPLTAESGEVIGLIGIGRDITLQKRHEEQLREAVQILKETQVQLVEAEKLKCVGRLAAGVAHEVKNPLAVLRMGIDYLEQQIEGEPEAVELLEDMRTAVSHADEVIFKLLDFSSPIEDDMQVGNLDEIISKAIALMEHHFEDANVVVSHLVEGQSPMMRIDGAKMEQVFVNLFLNAVAAMPSGGALTIRRSIRRMNMTGSNVSGELSSRFQIGESVVVVEVEDSGQGIRHEHREKIFDPFFSTKRTGEGVGLGLSLARDIVEAHRGHIEIDNLSGRSGARVVMYFPAASKKLQ